MALLTDGFSTTITFSAGVSGTTMVDIMKEKDVTPPGIDGGGENDTSNMRNTIWRTRQPKSLKTLTNSEITISYDPELFNELLDMVNVNQSITLTWPDDTTLVFWGWLNSFIPGANIEGEQPTAVIMIIPSNQNSAGAETAPVQS